MRLDPTTAVFLMGVAVGVGAVVFVLRKRVDMGRLGGFQWLVPTLLGAVGAFGTALTAGSSLEDAALLAVGGLLAGLGASGGHHAGRDVPFLPYGKKPSAREHQETGGSNGP